MRILKRREATSGALAADKHAAVRGMAWRDLTGLHDEHSARRTPDHRLPAPRRDPEQLSVRRNRRPGNVHSAIG